MSKQAYDAPVQRAADKSSDVLQKHEQKAHGNFMDELAKDRTSQTPAQYKESMAELSKNSKVALPGMVIDGLTSADVKAHSKTEAVDDPKSEAKATDLPLEKHDGVVTQSKSDSHDDLSKSGSATVAASEDFKTVSKAHSSQVRIVQNWH